MFLLTFYCCFTYRSSFWSLWLLSLAPHRPSSTRNPSPSYDLPRKTTPMAASPTGNHQQRSSSLLANCDLNCFLFLLQFRDWERHQSWRERSPEEGRWEARRYRHRLQGILLVHFTRRNRHHRQLGRWWERFPSDWWPSPHSTTDARTRRQDARRPQGRWQTLNSSISSPTRRNILINA